MKTMKRTGVVLTLLLSALAHAQSSLDEIIRLDAELATLERQAKLADTRKKMAVPSLTGAVVQTSGIGSVDESIVLSAIYGYAPDLLAEIEFNGALHTVRQGAKVGSWSIEQIQSEAVIMRKGHLRRALVFALRPIPSVAERDVAPGSVTRTGNAVVP